MLSVHINNDFSRCSKVSFGLPQLLCEGGLVENPHTCISMQMIPNFQINWSSSHKGLNDL